MAFMDTTEALDLLLECSGGACNNHPSSCRPSNNNLLLKARHNRACASLKLDRPSQAVRDLDHCLMLDHPGSNNRQLYHKQRTDASNKMGGEWREQREGEAERYRLKGNAFFLVSTIKVWVRSNGWGGAIIIVIITI
jgi:hypothetical protein